MLGLPVSNSKWSDGELTVTDREPFDIMAKAATADRAIAPTGTSDRDLRSVWLRL